MRTYTAQIDGRTYEIPEMWLVGMTSGPNPNAASYGDAIRWWHEQALMAEQFEAERRQEAA